PPQRRSLHRPYLQVEAGYRDAEVQEAGQGQAGRPDGRIRAGMGPRVIFMGTPDFCVPALRASAEAGHEIVAVYTQPPRAAGRRGLELTPSPVQREAERLGVPVHVPTSLKSDGAEAEFKALNADVAVVVAYGLLLPK